MKKYTATIFLLGLLIVALANVGVLSFQKTGICFPISSKTNDCFKPAAPYQDSEIERCNHYVHIGYRTNQLLKKLPVYLPGSSKSLFKSSLLSSSSTFASPASFDNNYLSYNYPSHNFW